MEVLPQEQEFVSNSDDNHFKSVQRNSNVQESSEESDILRGRNFVDNLESSDEDVPRKRILKHVKRFSDSDSDDNRKAKTQNGDISASENTPQPGKSLLQSDSESDTNITKSLPRKYHIKNSNITDSEKSESEDEEKNHVHIKNKRDRLRTENGSKMLTVINSNDESKQNSDSESDHAVKNEEQQLRMKNKRNKLKDRFKSLIKTRGKESLPTNNDEVNGKTNSESSSDSGGEMASIEKIKQKIKERMSFKPSICDPDTSDEESNKQKLAYKQKKERKTKLISPKPQRMSAKQAMENMQKIKSESNRMLREKEVTLPYHRPKALSLKDIMSRRKLAVNSDGKALPIKMNGDQLRQYAQMLEERQKEMMELCKSESEDEETNENPTENINTIGSDKNSAEFVNNTTENIEEVKDITEHSEAVEDTIKNTAEVVENCTEKETDANSAGKSSTKTTKDMTVSDTLNLSNDNKQQELGSTGNTDNGLSTEQNIGDILNDSETSMKLVYNDSANSIDENLTADAEMDDVRTVNDSTTSRNNVEKMLDSESEIVQDSVKVSSEPESQLISLHLDSENTENFNTIDITDSAVKETIDNSTTTNSNLKSVNQELQEVSENDAQSVEKHIASKNLEDELSTLEHDNEFSDDDINMEDIDKIIENAEVIKDIEDKVNSQFLIRDKPLNLNPKLTGAPGMVIDLDDSDTAPRKSGMELLKERFTYFCKLKTPEEIEREREKKLKPGTKLKKLKQELEEEIAEMRSLEWAKRLEDDKQHQKELKELRGEASDEDDIDKIEAAIEEKDEIEEGYEESDSGEEEPIENDIEIKDKPRVKNALLDGEAEESDCDENEDKGYDEVQNDDKDVEGDNDDVNDDAGVEGDDDESDSDESDESSESEEEQAVLKKGRILKAFEDSDEETSEPKEQSVVDMKDAKGTIETKSGTSSVGNVLASQISSQDEELQLAQRPKSTSDDLFTSQESVLLASEAKRQDKDAVESDDVFTQTFSILQSQTVTADVDFNSSGKTTVVVTQSLDINNIDDANLCPITDSQNLPLPSQIPTTQLSQSQAIGEDILALCTGQFYNNQFVSQLDNQPLADSQNYDAFDNYKSQDSQEDETQPVVNDTNIDKEKDTAIDLKETEDFIELNSVDNNKANLKNKENNTNPVDPKETENLIELNITDKENKDKPVDENLKSILDELADPEFDSPKPNKFFVTSDRHGVGHTEIQMKRKLVIDSDDETIDGDTNEPKKRKKLKKKKPGKRALQISDDEDEQSEHEEMEEYSYESDIEEDNIDRLVEYDSEENEIEAKAQNPKKKRKMAEFFENEAELTSEDEWAGSGDEDERGLDRMEREAGDDDTFHQGALQRELGQIHMRDLLDQDKREVRLIQELMFEDGDLGAGGRQRKFRWSNLGDEETGTVPDEFADTQEQEFESEEQWRKQRHERETFLRQLNNKDEPDESLNVSINRTSIIKANLLSKTMSSLLMEVNSPAEKTGEKTESPPLVKKTAKDIPSPKKPFALMQYAYQGSLLSRGRGALARLAALATPLAADEDTVGTIGPNSRRNFVFATLTAEEKAPKVTKRRAESNPSTPKLVKKLRTEDKKNSKSSLLDHFRL